MEHGEQAMDQMLYNSLTPMERNCLRLAHHECKAEEIAHHRKGNRSPSPSSSAS
jgi:hypothetical protein